jgi:hypothetical protein
MMPAKVASAGTVPTSAIKPLFGYGFDAKRRMHHHDKDDAEALGVVYPVNASVVDLSAVHFMRATSRRIVLVL